MKYCIKTIRNHVPFLYINQIGLNYNNLVVTYKIVFIKSRLYQF
jgi:hypothetical protein